MMLRQRAYSRQQAEFLTKRMQPARHTCTSCCIPSAVKVRMDHHTASAKYVIVRFTTQQKRVCFRRGKKVNKNLMEKCTNILIKRKWLFHITTKLKVIQKIGDNYMGAKTKKGERKLLRLSLLACFVVTVAPLTALVLFSE